MTHVHEDIGAYVLGALDEAAHAPVAQHLRLRGLRGRARGLARLPALLDLAVASGVSDEEPLPPAIEERLLDRFARERACEPPRRRRWRPRLAVAFPSALVGAVVAAAALILGFNFQADGGRPPTQYRLVLQPVERRRPARQRPGRPADHARGHRHAALGLEPAGRPQDVYEVFCDAKGWSASAGTFRVDAQGNGYVILTWRGQARGVRVVADRRRRRSRTGESEDYHLLRELA